MNLFEQIFGELNRAKVRYLVVGGVAVNLHGYRRFTGDIDILLLLEEKNLERMDIVMKKLNYHERLPVTIRSLSDHVQVKKWLKENNMTAYSFMPMKEDMMIIDILTEKSLKFENFEKRKILKKINKINIPVVSVNDLIKMKKEAGRDDDLKDLKFLEYLRDL